LISADDAQSVPFNKGLFPTIRRKPMLGTTELILILLIVVMLFGAKRIPEIMSGLGKGIKTFKKAIEGEDDSGTASPKPDEPPSTQTSTQQGNDSASGTGEKVEPK
jgi:sec-independent protein translocase protein TatA